ncbi:hypothetical protein D5086_021726 [Populus alba]|uniref:Uncharacterized protein n=1 Tax=Populus alba TaxID=43335 RepID=A0ACC4BD11_POPAL
MLLNYCPIGPWHGGKQFNQGVQQRHLLEVISNQSLRINSILDTIESVNKDTLETAQFYQGDALYVERKVMDGETANNKGKGAITVAKEIIIGRNAPIGTLCRCRAIGNRVKATNYTTH